MLPCLQTDNLRIVLRAGIGCSSFFVCVCGGGTGIAACDLGAMRLGWNGWDQIGLVWNESYRIGLNCIRLNCIEFDGFELLN